MNSTVLAQMAEGHRSRSSNHLPMRISKCSYLFPSHYVHISQPCFWSEEQNLERPSLLQTGPFQSFACSHSLALPIRDGILVSFHNCSLYSLD
ncbi:hypothetical protein Peur_047281 [Populus x canadensis]